ncbi:1-phosphofructokinase, partial [Salmonella enterica]
AAFLSQWLSTGEVEYALSLASATGADVASSAGLGQLAAIETLLSQIHVRKL